MSVDSMGLERKMRVAYERGRWHWALLVASVILGLSCVGLGLAARDWPFYLIAVALSATVGLYIWRGGDSGNALLPGLAVSLVPMLLSATMLNCGAGCSGSCMRHCIAVCAVGAAAAGLLAAYLLRHHPRKHRAWLFAVALVPASGLLGCPHIGYGELGGLAAGLLLAKAFASLPFKRSQ